jgi:hypothetical protein
MLMFDYYTKHKLDGWQATIFEQSPEIDYVSDVTQNNGLCVMSEVYYLKETSTLYRKTGDVMVEAWFETWDIVKCLEKIGFKDIKFVDATTLNICGHTLRTDKSPYFRFDSEPYNVNNSYIERYSRYSTGLYVMFRTNSSQVVATWENVSRRVGDNMTAITQLGLDLYIKHDGRWVFCQSGRVSTDPTKNKRIKTIVKNLAEGERSLCSICPCGVS